VNNFFEQLKIQRWDDHRFYHHSRVNQTLHLISAISFLVAYTLLLIDPPLAALVAWLVSMTTRQCGHFFFEPKGFDAVNQVTHEYKEEVKVGYNLKRKVVLLGIWAAAPLVLVLDPSMLGYFEPHHSGEEFVRHIGTVWLAVGVVGLVFRTVHLFFLKDVLSGLVWMTKILSDPFHDIYLYYKAPLALMRGELIEGRRSATDTAV
jgi:hypothetical protein